MTADMSNCSAEGRPEYKKSFFCLFTHFMYVIASDMKVMLICLYIHKSPFSPVYVLSSDME